MDKLPFQEERARFHSPQFPRGLWGTKAPERCLAGDPGVFHEGGPWGCTRVY